MKAELPWKASGDFLAYLSGNIVIMCCIDSLACRFASFVRTDGGGDVGGGCWTAAACAATTTTTRPRPSTAPWRQAARFQELDTKPKLRSSSPTAPRPPCMRRRRLHYVGAAPPRAEYSRVAERTVGWVRLVSQSRQYRRVRF